MRGAARRRPTLRFSVPQRRESPSPARKPPSRRKRDPAARACSSRAGRPFLRHANFRAPYEGFQGTAAQKIVAGGLYFPLEDAATRTLGSAGLSRTAAPMLAGTLAGLTMAVLLNPLSVTKYNSWGTEHRGRQLETAAALWRTAGPKAFLRGLPPTLMRDVVWGATYSGLRHELSARLGCTANSPGLLPLASNIAAALVATALSAPFNYVRNISYGSPTPVYTHAALLSLWRDAAAAPEGVVRTLQLRMCLGWGTLRVGVGMGLGSQMYGGCMRLSSDAGFGAVEGDGG